MIGIIAAVSKNGVIGVDNNLPFSYKKDLAHFRTTTINSTVIMGRNTFDSLGRKPLPKRNNIVITSSDVQCQEVKTFLSLQKAIVACEGDMWLIGGNRIYQEGMSFADKIILTITPDIINNSGAVKFPWINPLLFQIESVQELDKDCNLQIVSYRRK